MSRSKSFCGAYTRKTLNWLLLVLALVLAIREWICMPALVFGTSMAPTLRDRQVVWVNKLAYLFRPPARGDIVCIWTGRELLIKRIIGLPGEEVALQKGKLYVNGRLVSEPYLDNPGEVEMAPGRISVNSFGVIGDNRLRTIVALVNRHRIVGELIGRREMQPSASLAAQLGMSEGVVKMAAFAGAVAKMPQGGEWPWKTTACRANAPDHRCEPAFQARGFQSSRQGHTP